MHKKSLKDVIVAEENSCGRSALLLSTLMYYYNIDDVCLPLLLF